MRKKFVTWYAEEIKKQMDAGVPAESIDVNLKLTSPTALHASWLIEFYNVLTTADGRETPKWVEEKWCYSSSKERGDIAPKGPIQ